MNKDEILEKSRKENKNQDLYEKEISQKAGNIAAIVAAVIGTIFYVIQILVGGGSNYGLYAIVFSIPATGYMVKTIQMKTKRDLVISILYILVVLFFSFIHVNNLIISSTIL